MAQAQRSRRVRIAALATAGALAFGTGSVLVAAPARAALPSTGMAPADVAGMFGSYGDAGGHWTGGDTSTSVPLPDGRDAWLFSDTFLGTVNSDGSRPTSTPMVHNSMVIQDGTTLTSTLTGGTASAPTALVSPADTSQYYWVGDGTVEGNTLKVLYGSYKATGGGGPLDFALTGTALATFALPGLTLSSVTDLGLGTDIGWGASILEDGAYTYIYGTSSTADGFKFLHVARVPAGGLSGAWEFWTGSAWSAKAADAAGVLSGVGNGFGMQKVGSSYVLITQENNIPFDPDYVAYTSDSPTGPFSGPVQLFTAPEATAGSGHITYDVRLHPELARPGKLLVSYNVNSLNSTDNFTDARLYRPRFVEVDWPHPVPDPATLPAAPDGFTVSTDSSGGAHLSWNAVSGATQYRVYQRDTTAGQTFPARLPTPVTGTSTDLGGLRSDHTYEYAVTAQNSAGEGPASATVSVTPHIAPPPAPTGLTATADDNGQIALAWQPVDAAWNYEIYRRDVTAGETTFSYVTKVAATQTSYTAGWLQNNDVYEFYVTAIHGGGTSPASVTAQATAHYTTPGPPTGLAATSNADGSITLNWTAPPGAAVWYWVYQRDVTAGETSYTKLSLPATGTQVTLGFLQDAHTYEFTVSSVNNGGESAQATPVQAIAHFPVPGAPANLKATPGDGQATLSWDATGPNDWYWVYQRDVTAGETAFTRLPLPVAGGTSATPGYLTNTHVYEFKVTAIGAGGVEGPASATVQVTPNVPLPAKVTGLTATANPDGSITLSWDAQASNVWYWVYVRDVTAGDTGFTKLAYPVTTGATWTATQLTNGHTYQYEIAGTDSAGDGPTSDPATAVSHYTPPAAPTGLRGTTNGDGGAELTWTAPAANLFYWVYSRDVTAGQSTFTKSTYPTTNTSATLSPLRSGDLYEFKVTGENPGGEGPASSAVQVTVTGGLPAAPTNLSATAGDGSATMRWTASSSPNVWYWIEFRAAGGSWQRAQYPLTTCCSFTLSGLANGTSYDLRVRSTNASGDSTPSNVVTVRPLPPLPSAPGGLSASAGDGQVTLSWSASFPSNVYYWVEYSANGGGWQRLKYPVSTCCSFTVGYLLNGTTYAFRVIGTNLAGDGPASNVASARPMPPFPQPPTNLSASPGDGKVTLKWTASPTGNVWYWIEMRSNGGAWQRLAYPYTGCCTMTVSYLTNGVTYDFRLRSTNLSGDSDPSNVATAKPMPPFPSAPTITGTSGSVDRVSLSWSASSTPGVMYWIYYRDGSRGDTAWRSVLQGPGTTSADLWGLFTNGDVYEFEVAAFNLAGEARSGLAIEVPRRVRPGSAPTHFMNRVINGANRVAQLWALAHSQRCLPDYLQTVCFGTPPSFNHAPATVGDYFFFNGYGGHPGTPDGLEDLVVEQAIQRYSMRQQYGSAIADSKGPNLLRHEAVHSNQYAYWPSYLIFLDEYGIAWASSLPSGFCRNWLEEEANLFRGGYSTYPHGGCEP